MFANRSFAAGVGILALAMAPICAASELVEEEDYLLRQWSSKEGLVWGDIQALCRTPDGFLWIATDLALVRFDGSQFKALGLQQFPVPSEDHATCLLVDRLGRLWVGTAQGRLLRYDGGRLQDVAPGAGPAGHKLTALAEDGQGAVWGATRGDGLWRFHKGDWRAFNSSNGLPNPHVSSVVCDAQNQIWALAGGQLMVAVGDQVRALERSMPVVGPITAITAARGGGLWASVPDEPLVLGQRVFRFKDGVWSEPNLPYPWPQDSKNSLGNGLMEDESGRVWATTGGGRIFYWSKANGWSALTEERSEVTATPTSLIYDKEGTLWFGVRGGQLFRADRRAVSLLSPESAPNQHIVHSACVRRDGSLWMATYGAGIFRYHNGRWTNYGTAHGLESLHVFTLLEDRQNNLWAGARGGLYKLHDDRFEKLDNTSWMNAVLSLFEDRDGMIWVGSNNGLGQYNDASIKGMGSSYGVHQGDIFAISQDAEGRMWFALAKRGLYRREGKEFMPYATHSPLDSAEIRTLHFDAQGALWAATFGQGLFRLQGDRINQWRVRDGLPSDYLFTLVEDAQGWFWMSTANGVFGCSTDSLERSARGETGSLLGCHLTTAQGLDSPACSGHGQPVATRMPDGRLCFPNQRALALFDPVSVSQSKPSWPVIVSEVTSDGILQIPDANGIIRVLSGLRLLEFHYTVADLTSAASVRFRYQLKGLENDWRDAGSRRMASYARVPPGRYEFSVMAGGADGVWRESSRPLAVVVIPRWWQRTSVRAATISGLLGALVFLVWTVGRTRLRRRLQLLEVMQAAEAERQRIARDLHDNLGAGLTEIALMSDMAKTVVEQPRATENRLNEIFAASRGLARSLDETVWAISRKNETVEQSLTFICKAAQDFLRHAGIACRIESPDLLPGSHFSSKARHNVFLATREALNNIVKHARATEVWLRVRIEGNRLILIIEDNGKGFSLPPAVDASAPTRSGLTNLENRLAEIGGLVAWQSEPGKGTCLTLSIPITPENPRPD